MRTSIINQLIRGIFFLFLVLMLTACTSREDIVLELDGHESGTESTVDADRDLDVETGTETAPSGGSTGAPEAGTKAENSMTVQDAVIPPDIYVHICGAVENPGVYQLAAGSRVYEGQRLAIPTVEEADAAKAAGSYQALWQEDTLNTGLQEPGAAGMADNSSGSMNGLVNINTAEENELSAIPGIGAGKAAAIIQYRQENGNFASIEDIMKVSGIKEGTFEKIEDKITVK